MSIIKIRSKSERPDYIGIMLDRIDKEVIGLLESTKSLQYQGSISL